MPYHTIPYIVHTCKDDDDDGWKAKEKQKKKKKAKQRNRQRSGFGLIGKAKPVKPTLVLGVSKTLTEPVPKLVGTGLTKLIKP